MLAFLYSQLDKISSGFPGRKILGIYETALPGGIFRKAEPFDILIELDLRLRKYGKADPAFYHHGCYVIGSGLKHHIGSKAQCLKTGIYDLTEGRA